MTEFADWLSTTARGLGYRTDAQLAAALEVQQSTVTRWRKGNQPQIKHLIEMARLFQMPVAPLLVLAGHVPADLLGGVEPAGLPMTESVRRIRDAPLTDLQKKALTVYWDKRLADERQKLSYLIDWIAAGDSTSRQEAGDSLLDLITQGVRSQAATHLMELIETLVAIEATPRKRRRRTVRQDSPDDIPE
ncbi:helix-turn-helix domain-containing protein [Nonomuraea typhae]|uniref:helix-turn-helix domain-containing protein n=1 Tax=Nonomuraea typhae TaxID=2603600 RepID=UPI0012F93916|nr:helix-turn-helix domain-containing protein [Nonomuraea typhae]